jgi:biotin operon repressor
VRKKNYQCLMIETPDQRRFFTHEKYLNQLVEFAHTFDAQVSVVRVEESEILDLAPLADALSDSDYSASGPFTLVEKKIEASPTPKRSRTIAEIKDHVKNRFLSGDVVTLHDTLDLFRDQTSYAGLSTMLYKVRKELRDEGHEVEKVGAGRYRLAARPGPVEED